LIVIKCSVNEVRGGNPLRSNQSTIANAEGTAMSILTVNLVLSTFVFWIAARLYLLPRLSRLEPRAVALPILLLHATRHLGLMFLAPGAIYPGIPQQFAVPAAFGDLVAAVLALIAIPAVANRSPLARPLVGLFTSKAPST
jgi:hypothetical protein